LNFGSAIHAALEYRYTHLKNQPVTSFDEQDIFDNVLKPHFDKNPQPDEDHRSLGFAFEVFKQYTHRYVQEPFQLITKEDGSVMAEMSFSVPLFDAKVMLPDYVQNGEMILPAKKETFIPVYYIGRIDLPVIWDGQLIILDHKTTSMLGAYYFDGQKVSPQFEGYCWAFEKLTGRMPAGYCINAIRTKEMPGKPRGTWDAWWDEGFARHKEYLRPTQLDEWYNNTCNLIEEYLWHYSRNYMPQRKKACTMYGRCPYYEVCYLSPESRSQVLMSDAFQDHDWSPLK
jgi:hypothetical protein